MPLIPPNRVTVFPLKDDLQWYDPDVVFQPFDDIFGRGVVGSTDLQVVQNTPDGQISVQPGHGYVPYSGGGKRFFKTSVPIRSDAAEFLTAIPTWPGSGNPKIHRVIARIKDATLNAPDVIKGGVFDVLAGAATAGANLTNLSGAQAVPSDALLLGNVLQNGATIPTANIDSTFGTVRARARIGAGSSPTKGFEVNGAALTDRGWLNLLAGTNISITAADNPGSDSADVTIAATTPALPIVRLFDYMVAGSAKASIDTFSDNSNILLSQAYSCLIVRGRVQSNTGASDTALNVNFNNDVTADYDNVGYFWNSIGENQSSVTTGDTKFQPFRFNAASSNSGWGSFTMTIMDYATTLARLGFHCEAFDTGVGIRRWISGGNWHGSALSRISFAPGAGSFVVGSHIQVYGIL